MTIDRRADNQASPADYAFPQPARPPLPPAALAPSLAFSPLPLSEPDTHLIPLPIPIPLYLYRAFLAYCAAHSLPEAEALCRLLYAHLSLDGLSPDDYRVALPLSQRHLAPPRPSLIDHAMAVSARVPKPLWDRMTLRQRSLIPPDRQPLPPPKKSHHKPKAKG